MITHKKVTISLPKKTIKQLEKIAKKENKPKSRVIDTMIQNYYRARYKTF